MKPLRSTLVLSANSASTPLSAELGEAVQVEVLSVDRRLIDLEVAGVDDGAGRRGDGERHAVGHAVRDADELHGQRSDGDRLRAARPASAGRVRRCRALRAWAATSASVNGGAVDRAVEERRHVRHGADVIFVPVREHQRLDLRSTRFDER